MRDFLHSKRFKILVAVLAVLFGFMLYAVATGDIATVPSKVVSVIVTPFQKLSSSISTSVSDFLDSLLIPVKTIKRILNSRMKLHNYKKSWLTMRKPKMKMSS